MKTTQNNSSNDSSSSTTERLLTSIVHELPDTNQTVRQLRTLKPGENWRARFRFAKAEARTEARTEVKTEARTEATSKNDGNARSTTTVLIRQLPKAVIEFYDSKRGFGKLLLNGEQMRDDPTIAEQLLYFHCRSYRPCEIMADSSEIILSDGGSISRDRRVPQVIPAGTEVRYVIGEHPTKGPNARLWTLEVEYKELQKQVLGVPVYRVDFASGKHWQGNSMVELAYLILTDVRYEYPTKCRKYSAETGGRWIECENPLS